MRNSSFHPFAPAFIALALFTTPVAPLRADEADEIKLLREQVRALERHLLVLERKQEIQDERVAVTERGYTLSSSDAGSSVRLRGLIQLDTRLFVGDAGTVNNAFVLRRARSILEGTFGRIYSFQLVPEFGGGATSILDANLGVTLAKSFRLRAGKFKSPVGLEQLQSDASAFFTERSLVTNLVPNRDLGVQAGGEMLDGRFGYTVGIFNGVADGASTTNTDIDNEKDLVARLTAAPFKNTIGSPLQGLTLGLAASLGREKGGAALTAGYRTDGQQSFFRYRSNVLADGQSWRISPQASYYNGSFGALAEYVVSTVNLRSGLVGPVTELQHQAWQVAAGYVLTGEKADYTGVVPDRSFDPAGGSWGALEVVARYAALRIDEEAFPVFADSAASAKGARSVGFGLNWYLSKSVRATVDYYQTRFTRAGLSPSSAILQQDEKVFITRLQLSF